jgi:predicted flap endonuclease-1-like 5' DNA nuclease
LLQATLVATKEKLQVTRRELERLEPVEDQLVEMEAEFRQTKEELKQLRLQRDQAVEAETSTREIVQELREELNDRLDSLEVLRRDKETASSQLQFAQRQYEQVEAALGQAEQRMAMLQQESDRLAMRHQKLVEQNGDLNEQVSTWRAKAREWEERSQIAERQFAQLSEQLDSEQQMARKLRRRRFVTLDDETSGDGRAAFSFRDMRLRESTLREQDEAKLVKHSDLGKVYLEPPRKPDDLKKIPGIAEREERALQQLGVYTYRQIMEWTAEIASAFALQLSMADSETCEDWIGHARQLFHQQDRSAA